MPRPIGDHGPSMSVAPAFCRLVLGTPEAAAAAAAAATPGVDRVDEIAGAWLACRAELERRGDALAWGDVASGQSRGVVAGLVALPDLERGAVAAQAPGLEPDDIERALGTEPGAARGLLARAHAGLAGLPVAAGAVCVQERERLAYAPAARGARTADHCAECRAFRAAVDEQRLELRRAAGAGQSLAAPPARPEVTRPDADSPRRPEPAGPAGVPSPAWPEATRRATAPLRRDEPIGPAAAPLRRDEPIGPAAAPSRRLEPAGPATPPRRTPPGKVPAALRGRAGVQKSVAALRRGADAGKSSADALRRRVGAANPRATSAPEARDRAPRAAAGSGFAAALTRRLEPEGRGPRAAVAVAVLLGSGLLGFGAVNALETPRQDGGDPGVVTATPVGPLPPGVGPTEP